jgi:homoserine dehydrogenase
VAPHILPESNLLSNVEDVFNCIVVRGNAIGDAMFYGKGAGKLPTASAVVADVIDAAKHFNARKYIYWEKGSEDYLSDPLLMESRWFIRAEMGEEEAEKIFGSIQVIGEKPGAIAFTVGPVSEKVLIEKLNGRRLISCYRILD